SRRRRADVAGEMMRDIETALLGVGCLRPPTDRGTCEDESERQFGSQWSAPFHTRDLESSYDINFQRPPSSAIVRTVRAAPSSPKSGSNSVSPVGDRDGIVTRLSLSTKHTVTLADTCGVEVSSSMVSMVLTRISGTFGARARPALKSSTTPP